ncbi:MAG TPA: DUF3488 and transglutaminase-like domain-containing protein [Candidatus Acidoferrum sp.]|nr:DUF3488 and transglutaminase-like domain-containing protein [Candidatus Acidoferrum sp.]
MAEAVPAPELPALPAERFFRTSLFLLIAASVATLVTTGKLDLPTEILAAAAVAYKGVRWWRGDAVEIPHHIATRLVAGYLLFFPVDVFFLTRAFVADSPNPVLYAALLGAVHFLLFVMIIRLYSAASDRDALFLSMLSFAGVLASAVLTIDTTFLVLFFLFLLSGVGTFVGLEMRRGSKGTVTPTADGQYAEERRLTRALVLAALSVALGAMILGGALFFFFPRFGAGYFGRATLQPSLMSGFSDDVELGQIGQIKKNSEVVMRVRTARPVEYAGLRWRGIALSDFDGKRWSTADRSTSVIPARVDGWIPLVDRATRVNRHGMELRYTVLLKPVATDALFAAPNAVSIRGNLSGVGSNTEMGARRSYIFRDSTDSLFNPFHNYTTLRYEGVSILPAVNAGELRDSSTDYPEEIRENYLQLPPLDPRIPELARQVTAGARTPFDKAAALQTYLRTKFAYTLNLTGRPGSDALAHFLFETRAGHCEYFASALAILLRTLGIPTREVNGFLPGEYNDLGGDYIVRESDAHSWVEVYFTNAGWITFDPTPPGAAGAGGLLTRLGQYLDWFELSWNEWVINYDFMHQILLAQTLQRSTRNWTEAARAWTTRQEQRGRQWIRSSGKLLRALILVAVALFLLGWRSEAVAGMARRLWLSWLLRSPGAPRTNPQLASRLYGELLHMLAKRGLARTETQTPLEFAEQVSAPLVEAVREFTLSYTRARFGGAPCDTPRLRALLEQVRDAR